MPRRRRFLGRRCPRQCRRHRAARARGSARLQVLSQPVGRRGIRSRQRSRPARGHADHRQDRVAAAGARGNAGAAARTRSRRRPATLCNLAGQPAGRRRTRGDRSVDRAFRTDIGARAHRAPRLRRRARVDRRRACQGPAADGRNLSPLPDVCRGRRRRRRHGAENARRRSARASIASGCGARWRTA